MIPNWKLAAGTAALAAAIVIASSHREGTHRPVAVLAQASTAGLQAADRSVAEGVGPGARPARSIASDAPRPVEPSAALGSNEVPSFEVDPRGNLVTDAHTRNELERLLALNDREQSQALLRQLASSLPAGAYRQATDAFYAYQNYSQALTQAFPPQQPVTDEVAAVRQLDALHALRVQQFGIDTAQAYFGDEEATARKLLAAMQAQRVDGGTFDERAERAQQQQSQPAAAR